MSDMMFREPNQIKWLGTRPGHNGTQLLHSDSYAALGWQIHYTVPAGERAFITHLYACANTNVTSVIALAVYDGGGLFDQWLASQQCMINWVWNPINLNYWPPLELAAGESIRYAQSANCQIVVVAKGWVE